MAPMKAIAFIVVPPGAYAPTYCALCLNTVFSDSHGSGLRRLHGGLLVGFSSTTEALTGKAGLFGDHA